MLLRVISLCLFLLTAAALSPAFAHPPAGKLKPLPPEVKALVDKALRTKSEADLLEARKALAKEGRFSCCISGGCTECMKEGACACGPNLLAKDGVCKECVEGWKAGAGKFEGIDLKEVRLEQMGMRGMTGPWLMNREGTGTSWLPDASPMYASMRTRGTWNFMTMGYAYGVATKQKVKNRGDDGAYLSGYGMVSTWNGTLGLRAMGSFDPITLGRGGYPLLLQGGAATNDRQHPHDLVKELAVTATGNIKDQAFATLYVAPIGEPALGPTAYIHRPSAFDNPEAPLSHHALDFTHITPGVITGSLATQTWKLDASLFNGHAPDNRYTTFDTVRLDSRSMRLSMNPTPTLALQVSHGYLNGSGGHHGHTTGQKSYRTTASAIGTLGDWNSTLAWATDTTGQTWLLEGARLREKETLFFRAESVASDLGQISKLTLGGVHNLKGGLGVGASVSVHAVPGSLRRDYGRTPVTANIFLRTRTGRM